jgi:hypothetical protein
MLKFLVKLGIAALILHAGWRIGAEYLTYFEFRDAVRQDALVASSTEDELRDAVFDRADEFGITLDEPGVSIERDRRRTLVEGSYTSPVQILPRYFYPWTFRWTVEVFTVPDARTPDAPAR